MSHGHVRDILSVSPVELSVEVKSRLLARSTHHTLDLIGSEGVINIKRMKTVHWDEVRNLGDEGVYTVQDHGALTI